MRRALLVAVAVALTALPARADVVRQTATDVPVLRKAPDGAVKGFGYRGQLVDVSNCFETADVLAGKSLYALGVNLSTGFQGYEHGYYLGGACAG